MKKRSTLPNSDKRLAEIIRPLSGQFINRIAIAIAGSGVGVYLFKIIVYDKYVGIRKFPDYGPTLFSGGQPDILLLLYVVLVASATCLGWIFTSPSVRSSSPGGLLGKGIYHVGMVTVALMVFTVSITAMATGGVYTWHYSISLFLLGGISLAVVLADRLLISVRRIDRNGVSIEFVLSHKVSTAAWKVALAEFAKYIFIFIFIAIVVFHLRKISVLYRMAAQSSMKNEAASLLFAMLFGSGIIGYFLARSRPLYERLALSIMLPLIYLVSIRESWVYWGIDAFHEGESFLTANLLIHSPYKFLEDFFPVHGMGRNILHGYYASIFSDNNLYFYRIVQALTYPFVHVLIAAFLYRYTKKIFVPLTFFLISYLFGFIEERDVSPFFLMALLLVPLETNKNEIPLKIATGVTLFLESIFSLELFVLLNIAMAMTFIYNLYMRIRYGSHRIPWIHAAYYVTLLAALLFLGSGFSYWLGAVGNALAKSPNLLQRSLEAPKQFSFSLFMISSFFALFLLFHLTNVVAFLRGNPRMIRDKNMLVVIFSLVSLMFFTRAFNRSDIGHILYAYSISLPVILGFALRYRYIKGHDFLLGSLCLTIFLGATYLQKGNLSINILKQRPLYDARLARREVRPLQSFGAIQIPSGTISDDSHMTAAELNELQSVVRDGFKIFDMSNQPVLIYGAVKSPLVTNDIHTLFYNTYGEQLAAIRKLKSAGKTVVLWSAGYWTETLDSTYVEYRLPILSEYINTAYPFTYRIGRFVILADQPLAGKTALPNGRGREQYDLGFAPSRMGPYRQENAFALASFSSDRIPIGEKKPDAVAIDVSATENGRIGLQLFSQGRPVCKITFSVVEGASVNFIRLANLPAYYSAVDELTVKAESSNVRVENVKLLRLTKEDSLSH